MAVGDVSALAGLPDRGRNSKIKLSRDGHLYCIREAGMIKVPFETYISICLNAWLHQFFFPRRRKGPQERWLKRNEKKPNQVGKSCTK